MKIIIDIIIIMVVSTHPEHIEGDPLDGGHQDQDVGRLRRVHHTVTNHHHLQTWLVFEISPGD